MKLATLVNPPARNEFEAAYRVLRFLMLGHIAPAGDFVPLREASRVVAEYLVNSQ